MFVRKKTLKNNNKLLFERNTNLNKANLALQRAVKDLENKNRELGNELVITSEILDDKRKEIKRLKTLLTKNGINYRKEN